METLTDIFGVTPIDKELEEEKSRSASNTIPELNYEDPAKQQEKIQKLFNEVFNTDHGRIVLGIILEDLYYFRNCTNDESRALNNYAKVLLSNRLGLVDNKKRVDNLFNVN